MTTNETLREVSQKSRFRGRNVLLRGRRRGPHDQWLPEASLATIWPVEDQARCIPIHWVPSQARVVPVSKKEGGH